MSLRRRTNRQRKSRQPELSAKGNGGNTSSIYSVTVTAQFPAHDVLFIVSKCEIKNHIAAIPTPISVTRMYQPNTMAAEAPFFALLMQVNPITIRTNVQIVKMSMDEASL